MVVQDHSLTVNASHIVRLYLWDKLKLHMGDTWKPLTNDGRSVPPIIPAQEQPEAQDSGNPFIVYVYDVNGTSDLFQLQSETMALRIISQSPATVASTVKLCSRLFNKYDESARDINAWIRANYPVDPEKVWNDEVRNFSFRTVRISGVQGVQPADSEGGRVDATVMVEMDFVEKNMELGSNN